MNRTAAMPQPPLPEPPDSDATIMIPRPGGRRSGVAAADPEFRAEVGAGTDAQARSSGQRDGGDGPGLPLVGTNPLLAQASPLLIAVPTIRRTLSHRDPSGLREELLRAVTDFERGAREANCTAEHIQIARYCLCTMLDEAVNLMPWGESSGWLQRGLLNTLHGETVGGEKFFQYLNQALNSPRRDLDLLESLYACLALGFGGRYLVLDNGRAQLDALRDRVHAAIRRERGEPERDLSGKWRGVEQAPAPLVRRIPPWLVLGAVGLLLFVVFVVYTMLLAGKSDPVFASLAAVRADPGKYEPPVVPNAAPLPPTPPTPRLAPLLAAAIQAGQVEVVEDSHVSHVVIRGDNLFDPGKAEIKPELVAVIHSIAQAMEAVAGSIVVTGHTDDKAIRSLRFPSNYELSLERARGVANLVNTKLSDHSRVRSEGAAEAQPIANNATAEGRAKNRRVEITLRFAA